jgi:acetyl-CoA/propionyl-CoA carboxylase biotin carboxyl carrier protein
VSFSSVLVANRGDAALRVFRTLHHIGYPSIAVFTPADRGAPHVEAADDALEIPSYLDIGKIVEVAKLAGAAVHPGWGFLSQNPAFADAVEAAGLVFIGPSGAAMRRLGDKISSRATAKAAGVPVVPGTDALASDAEILAACRSLRLPVLLKAAAGGGGKGLRRIEREEGLDLEVAAARREAEAAFGDGRLFVERLVAPARHVEVQVVADGRGKVLAFGERDCTLQRRFQKIVEESPSPSVDPPLRARLRDAARRLAAAAGYRNAGTVEFLVRPDGAFHFMEMNTRLQVEHGITEAVYELDLVDLQLDVALGSPLPDEPGDPKGHAIEARIYAEDPDAGFLPMSGRILRLRWPDGVRVDHALREGLEIGPDFDPMLGKVIAHGPDRESARRRLLDALRSTVILGVHTNVSWLLRLLDAPEFVRGELEVGRLPAVPPEELPPALWAAVCHDPNRLVRDPWDMRERWRVGE